MANRVEPMPVGIIPMAGAWPTRTATSVAPGIACGPSPRPSGRTTGPATVPPTSGPISPVAEAVTGPALPSTCCSLQRAHGAAGEPRPFKLGPLGGLPRWRLPRVSMRLLMNHHAQRVPVLHAQRVPAVQSPMALAKGLPLYIRHHPMGVGTFERRACLA